MTRIQHEAGFAAACALPHHICVRQRRCGGGIKQHLTGQRQPFGGHGARDGLAHQQVDQLDVGVADRDAQCTA